MRRNPEIEAVIKNGITNARRLFCESNNIDENNILYIDNDSITTFHDFKDPELGYMKGNLTKYLNFRVKSRYTSFYRLLGIDFLYFTNGVIEQFRLKNVNEDKLKSLHTGYFLDLLLSIAYSAQTSILTDTLDLIKNVYEQYTNRELDVGFYREFNHQSKFYITNTGNYVYYTDSILPIYLNLIEIGFNANLIRLLYRIFMSDYFKMQK